MKIIRDVYSVTTVAHFSNELQTYLVGDDHCKIQVAWQGFNLTKEMEWLDEHDFFKFLVFNYNGPNGPTPYQFVSRNRGAYSSNLRWVFTDANAAMLFKLTWSGV